MKPRIFSQLFKSILGRGFLVLLIVFITYCHQVWGLIFVLFLIIIYSGIFNNQYNGYNTLNDDYQGYYNEFNYDYSFIEGFNTKDKDEKDDKNGDKEDNNSTPEITTPENTITKSTTTTTPVTNTTSKALEGFDLLGLEDNIKRGKQSSTIPMGQSHNSSDYVMPYDESMLYSRP